MRSSTLPLPVRGVLLRADELYPRALLSPDALARVTALARALPDAFSWACLECRLAAGDSRIDLLVCSMDHDRERLLPAVEGPVARSSWRGARDLCVAWANPEDELYRKVPFLWFEFDVDEPRPELSPFVFFCVQPEFMAGPLGQGLEKAPARAVSTEEYRAIVERSLWLLLGGPPAPALLLGLYACHDRLPEGGQVLHAAPLTTRGLDVVRLVLTLPKVELLAYLERVGWGGPRADVAEAVATFYEATSHVGCHLNVDATGVLPTLGLQIAYPGDHPAWRPNLERLVALERCTPQKRDALVASLKDTTMTLAGDRWPVQVSRGLEIKLSWGPRQQMEAKAYLGFAPCFSLR